MFVLSKLKAAAKHKHFSDSSQDGYPKLIISKQADSTEGDFDIFVQFYVDSNFFPEQQGDDYGWCFKPGFLEDSK